MKDLVNHRLSYHIVVTFDLINIKDTAAYSRIRKLFSERLQLENNTFSSKGEGGKKFDLPFNTFATVYEKDDETRDLKDWLSKEIEKIFLELDIKARYFVAVADNWSVGGYITKQKYRASDERRSETSK